eukprot:scaffold28929_cov71-Cyclotella_meneghiniana.AAC.17
MPPPTTRRCLGLWEERHDGDDDVREREGNEGRSLLLVQLPMRSRHCTFEENDNAPRGVVIARTRSGIR